MILILGVSLIAGVLSYAPGFLLYSTHCSKSDVIVLFLGPDFGARHKHAQNLMKRGMADYLIIPAYHKIYHMNEGTLKLYSNRTQGKKNRAKKNSDVPSYYEDTHIELIDAKKEMTQYGKTSAIFVSSPYHMRRIKIMVKKELGDKNENCYSPTPFERAPANFWELRFSEWKKVGREYLKIVWFMLYSQRSEK